MIDNKTIEQARNADIIAFLEKYSGFTFVQIGGAFRCKQHKSLAVKSDRRSFYWHSKSTGGFGALDYLMKVEGMPFRDAVEVITGTTPIQAKPQQEIAKPKTLILPEKTGLPLKLYDYLCVKRRIESDIVTTLIQKEILFEDKRRNIVFVGHDEHGKPRFASLRSTHGDYRGDRAGSDKRYGFNMAFSQSERLYIFESPIDAMSHASLDKSAWKQNNRLSLAGTSDTALPFFLNQHPYTKTLVFCLDNDATGRESAILLAKKYADKGYRTQVELPAHKDFNDDLQALLNPAQPKKAPKRNNDVSI